MVLFLPWQNRPMLASGLGTSNDCATATARTPPHDLDMTVKGTPKGTSSVCATPTARTPPPDLDITVKSTPKDFLLGHSYCILYACAFGDGTGLTINMQGIVIGIDPGSPWADYLLGLYHPDLLYLLRREAHHSLLRSGRICTVCCLELKRPRRYEHAHVCSTHYIQLKSSRDTDVCDDAKRHRSCEPNTSPPGCRSCSKKMAQPFRE
ncbi:unnamed protein product, partial [Mesorhabditis spiculigera]